MRFRLFYRGVLKANAGPQEKWCLRDRFHNQLNVLWKQQPLLDIEKYADPEYKPDDCYLGVRRGNRLFYPIVSSKLFTVAELDILMIRPGSPGSISEGGGDIDNRIKTLLDSLQPPNQNHLDTSTLPTTDPVYCLLEDDKLITRLSVETDRLLDTPTGNSNEVILVICVHVKATKATLGNLGIAI